MTEIRFFNEDKMITGYEISGHSSSNCDDLEGKIVCSAVSSAAYLTANTLSDVIFADISAEVDDRQGYMKIDVKSKLSESQITLKGFLLHARELASQYRNYVKVYSEV